MSVRIIRGFDKDRDTTRENSHLTKQFALAHLYSQGCRRVALYTCPGPALREEEAELAAILKDMPDLCVIRYYYELEPAVARAVGAINNDLFDGIELVQNEYPREKYDGHFFEWDGTHNHNSHLENGEWTRAMDILSGFNGKVVFEYTHSLRGRAREGESTFRPTTRRPSIHDRLLGTPWEGYLRDELASNALKPTLLFSTRNYRRDQLVEHGKKQKQGHTGTYRWVWAIE